jgi:pimeloyl-ACP methyl ester carboxylesterase
MKKYFQIDDRKVAVIQKGQGKPVFLLHGWGGTKESWERLTWEMAKYGLEEKHLTIAVDFPGFGESEEPDSAWGVTDYTRFLEKLVKRVYEDENLSGDYDLIVHSFGGRVLLKLLSPNYEHIITERPDKLVLIAAAGIKPPRTLRLGLASAVARLGKRILAWPVLRKLAPSAQKLLYKILKSHDYEKSSGVMRNTFVKVIEEDLTGTLSHIKNSALILWGKKDSYVPYSDGILMHKSISGSQMITISDGRHGIHKTHAEILAPKIVDFLK